MKPIFDNEPQLWKVVVGNSPWLIVKAKTGAAAMRKARKRYPRSGRGYCFVHMGPVSMLVL